MKFIFIRHSKTDRNPQVPIICWGLAGDGIALAEELSGKDVIKNLDVVYASFQTKALETAVILAKPNAIPIKADDRLTEVTSFTGPFEKDFDVYTKNVHDYYTDDLARIAGGETKAEALQRFNGALEAIAAVESDKEYVGIITHGNILTLFSALYKDVDCYELHTKIKQPDVAVFNWDEKKFESFFGEL
ncbi:MAG TPA: histidine phosphatase family protein [Candidatus Saccharimonadales bacterium]|jgi:broad specificity phosphatase PhoE|nr:histidine phosphatase family protein [Candidatus Saccharimonadales bacterium]